MNENGLDKKSVSETDEGVIKKRLLLSTFVIIIFPGAFIFFVICAILISKFTGLNQDKLVIGAMAAFIAFTFLSIVIFSYLKFRELR